MSAIADPTSGLQFFELSHEWGHGVPTLPGYDDVKLYRSSQHAKNGVMAHRLRTTLHTGTHLNAPRHLVAKAAAVGEIALERLFGTGVVLSIPKGEWQLITATDLQAAKPAIEADDIVVLCTGWHRCYSDSIEYFGHSPGLSKDGAQWLIDQGIKLLAIDTPQVDHPLATSLGPHRNGPQIKRLAEDYQRATGREALADFPDWNVAHKLLLGQGIPTVENVGGDVEELVGQRCTFQAYPWHWLEGDACPIRFVAITDPSGGYRLEAGSSA